MISPSELREASDDYRDRRCSNLWCSSWRWIGWLPSTHEIHFADYWGYGGDSCYRSLPALLVVHINFFSFDYRAVIHFISVLVIFIFPSYVTSSFHVPFIFVFFERYDSGLHVWPGRSLNNQACSVWFRERRCRHVVASHNSILLTTSRALRFLKKKPMPLKRGPWAMKHI